MIDGSEHSKRVDAWLQGAPRDLAIEQLLRRFELAFSAILGRAHQTLGEVTLTAIVDRVLYVAAETYPVVSALEVEGSAVSCIKLLERTRGLPSEDVVTAVRFVLVEFFSVLGSLTAEILTPALHAELQHEPGGTQTTRASRTASRASDDPDSDRHPHSEGQDDKGIKS